MADISHIKVGDTVFVEVQVGWSGRKVMKVAVTHKTAGGTIIAGEYKFRKNGEFTPRGDTWVRGPRLVDESKFHKAARENRELWLRNEIGVEAGKLAQYKTMPPADIRAIIGKLNELAEGLPHA